MSVSRQVYLLLTARVDSNGSFFSAMKSLYICDTSALDVSPASPASINLANRSQLFTSTSDSSVSSRTCSSLRFAS